jgi:hypothetical protein
MAAARTLRPRRAFVRPPEKRNDRLASITPEGLVHDPASGAASTVTSVAFTRRSDPGAPRGAAVHRIRPGIVTTARQSVLQTSALTIRTLAWRFEEVLRLGDGTKPETVVDDALASGLAPEAVQ